MFHALSGSGNYLSTWEISRRRLPVGAIIGGAAGHMLQMESPDEVSAAMVAFLETL